MTDKEKLLDYLKSGKRIDGAKAFQELQMLGSFRSRISDLRKEGHIILDDVKKTSNGKIYKEYYLVQQQKLFV